MANINLKQTDRNKDVNFAATKAGDAERFIFSEAIAVENGDDSVFVYGFCEKATGVEVWGDSAFKFTPMLLGVEIPLKDSSFTSKAGKEYKTTSTVQHKAIVHKIKSIGFGVPFSCELDMSVDAEVCSIILTGKKTDGTEATPKETTYVEDYALMMEVLEKLVKLEGVPLPEGKASGRSYGGSGGQKESARLADRLAFLKQLSEGGNDDLKAAINSAYGDEAPASSKILLAHLLENLFN